MRETEYLMDDEPTYFDNEGEALERLLLHLHDKDGSDLFLLDNEPAKMSIHGLIRPVTKRRLTSDDIKLIAGKLYKSENAITQILSGQPINDAYAIPYKDTSIRFRFNIIGCEHNSRDAAQITIRLISSHPKSVIELGVEQEIIDNFIQEQGLVLITGPTGSGKTTLNASLVRWILENKNTNLKIDAYESPIEYVYSGVEWNNNFITQTSVPSKIASFEKGIEESLRRKPNIIIVGETRKRDEISAALDASLTGHGVYATLHTNGVAESTRRLINAFNESEKEFRKIDIVESLRMVVSQRLVPSKDGKRIPIKSWFVFSDADRAVLSSKNFNEVPQLIREMVNDNKRSFIHDAARKYRKELITKETFFHIRKHFGNF